MKYCAQCGEEFKAQTNFCPSCGLKVASDATDLLDNHGSTTPSNKGGSAFLITLCILTLVGSFIGVLRGLFYQAVATAPNGNTEYYRGFLFVLVNLGTIAGAIVLLNKKYIGLYLYSSFQVLYLILILWTTSVYIGNQHTDMLALTISMFFFLPSLAFLIMYWTSSIRSVLH
jgi:uncharacterized membrane protein